MLLEERLAGREISVFALCDGRAMVPIAAACDYKRAGDGDSGPNTGGMGAYSPPHGFPDDVFDQVRERILSPMLRGLRAEGEEYIGVLYCGLMWTEAGPSVIEFNVRFGDPETQVMMPRINGDFAALLKSAADGAMDLSLATLSNKACVGVVLATAGLSAQQHAAYGPKRRHRARKRRSSLLGRLHADRRQGQHAGRKSVNRHRARRRLERRRARNAYARGQIPVGSPRNQQAHLPDRHRQVLERVARRIRLFSGRASACVLADLHLSTRRPQRASSTGRRCWRLRLSPRCSRTSFRAHLHPCTPSGNWF